MRISRRDFFKTAARWALGLASITVVPDVLRNLLGITRPVEAFPGAKPDEYEWDKHLWGFVVNINKCIGCGRCVVACKLENHVAWEPRYNRTWVERYVFTKSGEISVDSPNAGRDGFKPLEHPPEDIRKSSFVPKLCNQCENPPCVQVCPVGATFKTKDGVVLVDQERCIGCGYCIQACPYGARYLVPDAKDTPSGQIHVADKCNWCYHRITKGLNPACVEACPVGARVFGDLLDYESPVMQLLSRNNVGVLKADLGTKPKVFYIGMEEGMR